MKHGRPAGTVVKARPETDARARAWTSMRVLLRFDVRQICVTADVAASNVQYFIKRLRAAGYLRLIAPHAPGNGRRCAVYQLIRNTGPKAPITRKCGDVFDPNTNNIHAPISAKGERNAQGQHRT